MLRVISQYCTPIATYIEKMIFNQNENQICVQCIFNDNSFFSACTELGKVCLLCLITELIMLAQESNAAAGTTLWLSVDNTGTGSILPGLTP
jgi:hypothetical protein